MLAPPRRLRRSVLTTPASAERMLTKAATSNADYVIIDLEDSVAPAQKPAARTAACAAINGLDWSGKTVAVRVNGLGSPWLLDDLLETARLTGPNLDVIVVPKVTGPSDVSLVSGVLDHIELDSPHRIGIDVLIEEASAIAHLNAIVAASTRLESVAFGPGDYAASLRASDPTAGPGSVGLDTYAAFARQSIVVAARAAGAIPIDGPFADFSDPDGFRQEALQARHSGFAGKWVIHPAQIAAANDAFTPTDDEAARARAISAAYRDAQDRGLGAVAVDGKMVDAANARVADEIVAVCELIGI